MGMPAPLYHTAEMVRALPVDGNRYEAVHGELLLTPAPGLWHQELIRRLVVVLSAYLESEPVGHLCCSPADISWGLDTLVQPDLFVAPLEQARTLDWSRVTDLLLVAEVLSPSSRRADRFAKRLEYQRQGVPVYWIVDPDERLVKCWTPSDTFPAFERERLFWHPSGAACPFTLDLTRLFRPI